MVVAHTVVMANNHDEPMPTIWRVSDELWAYVEPILKELDPPAPTGRPRTADMRRILEGIIYRMRSGVQWNQLPSIFGSDTTVHRTFQRWQKRGVFERLWAVLIERCEELAGVNWKWQSADGAMGKARFGGISWVPTRPTVGNRASNAA